MIMMYISVFPIAISVRRTNVYEEKSLGIYGSSSDEAEDVQEPSYVGAHLRRQLSFDLWYIALGLFIIAIVEGDHLANTNDYAFTLFSVIFEIVSAYGTVGLSLGYPNVDTSFSGQFRVISKLVIIAMQIRGRHRGLPYELDRAIMLPSDALHKKEDADAAKRAHRRNSSLSHMDLPPGQALSSRTPTTGTNRGNTWPATSSGHGINGNDSNQAIPNGGFFSPRPSAAGIATTSGRERERDDVVKDQTKPIEVGHTIEFDVHHDQSGLVQRGLGKMMSSLTERTVRKRDGNGSTRDRPVD